MKLRIRGDSLRLRLTQGEVAGLVERGSIEDRVTFGPGVSLTYCISVHRGEDSKIEAILEQGTGVAIVVRASESLVHAWANDSNRVGFEAAQDLGGGKVLRILVEKDFACLVERPHEDDADAFPNPNTSC